MAATAAAGENSAAMRSVKRNRSDTHQKFDIVSWWGEPRHRMQAVPCPRSMHGEDRCNFSSAPNGAILPRLVGRHTLSSARHSV